MTYYIKLFLSFLGVTPGIAFSNLFVCPPVFSSNARQYPSSVHLPGHGAACCNKAALRLYFIIVVLIAEYIQTHAGINQQLARSLSKAEACRKLRT